MTAFVDVRFRGLRVAHKAKLTEGEGGVFVEFEQPLPVGSPLSVVEEGKAERPARVSRVVEHEAGAGPAGMRLSWDAGAVLREEAITVKVEKAPTFEEPSAAVAPAAPSAPAEASSADVSSDASTDGSSVDSSDDGGDRSTDGTVEAPVQNGNSSKKSKKNKRRR